MRLVDADAIVDYMNGRYEDLAGFFGEGDPYTRIYGSALCVVENAPIIDAVVVVRCKNCEYYNTDGCTDGLGWCEKHNNGHMDEDYCNYGL